MEEMTREDAETKYVRWVLSHGNPEFYILLYLQKLDNDELANELGGSSGLFPGEDFKVVDDW